ncbi:MAG: phytoene desaturase family protein [Candidatus Omnitrophica bacterium]|nr:phytoene desaturase family protein [Candidatus Omnitrophota bacterium]MDD5661250.1 phytoene desaturase family protein [Candidatus Omnitrophota bacterium]
MLKKKIVIIGAGVGGLTSACRLAKDGYNVEVYEKLSRCGGRCNIIEDRGYKFDTGPSFVLMPDFFEEVFSYCGKRIEDYLDLRAIDPSYKIFYSDGETLCVYRDSQRTKEELKRIDKGASEQFDKFIQETARIYNIIRPLLYKCVTYKSLTNPYYWRLVTKIRAFESYWQLARKYFKSDKLCYAFTFEAMFMGVSPYQAPAFYSIISYTDHVQKIFHPMGGMYQIPLALEKLAGQLGAKIYYDSEIENIGRKDGQISLLKGKNQIQASSAIVNADYAYAQTELLKRKIPDFKYSCSTYLIYLGINKKLNNLAHHNLFFAKDLKKNLDELFKSKLNPEDPSFYVHVPTITDPSLAPAGKDILYLLIPVPNLENTRQALKDHELRLRRIIFDKINKVCACNLEELIEVEHRFYPEDFIGRYNIKFGATFGLAHNLTQSAFFRPANFDPVMKNLYYVGASTQPGGGLPVVIAGSRIVADLINAAG